MSWPTTRLKNAAQVSVSNVDKNTVAGEPEVRLCNYVDVYKNNTITPDMNLMRATASVDQLQTFRVAAGDTLVTKDSETADDIAVPAFVAESAPDMVCGYHLALVRPSQGMHPGYLYWALASLGFQSQMTALATGVTRFGLRHEVIGNGAVPLPPMEEQRRIADFLDAETSRIDKLYELRRRSLVLLEERLTVRLDLAVRGGEPQGGMRAEYADLGQVPEHWRQGRLRSVECEVQTGPFGSQLHVEDYVDGGWPVVNPANIQPQGLRADSRTTVPDEVSQRLARHILRVGDVVFGRRGELGRAAVVTDAEEGWVCGTGSLRVRFGQGVYHPGYLRRYLAIPAVHHYFQLQAVGSTMPNLNSSILLGMPLLIPPITEQAEISNQCDEIENGFWKRTDLIERQLELLAERRQALITAAVTGEFDVSSASGRGVVDRPL